MNECSIRLGRVDTRPNGRLDATDRTVDDESRHPRQPSRDKILDRAEELFARRGFAGIGLAEVAEQVGLSKSSLFHHFSSKAQLYAAVMARILDRIEAELVRSLADGGGPQQRLERWLDVVIDVLAAHPNYARLLLRSLFEDDELTGALPRSRRSTQRSSASWAPRIACCARASRRGSSGP
jgi:AcrR family transcriptional regulator